MADQAADNIMERVVVRSYEDHDQAAVARLYTDGLLAGTIAPNDTGADIENVTQAYFADPASHFWVADLEAQVLAMIGVEMVEEHVAEIRRLRVDKQFQDTSIAERLVETALEHCHKQGHLKIVFDTRVDAESGAEAVVQLFDRFGFQHTRTRPAVGKDLLEFYLDLYRQPKIDEDE